MLSPTVVRVGDWSATSSERVWRGFTISARGFSGWNDGVDIDQPRVSRPGGHGMFMLPGYLTDRLVSVSGVCYASSQSELNAYGQLLHGLGADGREFKLTIDHAGQTLWAWAKRGSAPKFTERPGVGRAEWRFDFWCPDPRRFGPVSESVSSGGSTAVAHHAGNFEATSQFRVAGLWSGGYRIRGPQGQSFSVLGDLHSDEVDQVDFNTGRVLRNGQLLTGAVLSPETWTVPGGSQVQWRVEGIDGGSGSAVMYLPDTHV